MLPRQLLSAKRADSKAHHLSDSTLTVQLKEYSLRQLRLALFFLLHHPHSDPGVGLVSSVFIALKKATIMINYFK
ncbi:hypothetical protein [Pseudomonas nunensis]|uniref:hypothetical protein n=1 Tax=Pseudomonas nunensis TaxID=2961896 RepID=UPI0006B652DC|nr:hypothetical protein [Pseudomonas nunensis]KOX99794.1 hypothetical protein AM274_23480 [Pseudomonas nunensis]